MNNEDLSISFDWEESWSYGGYDSGDFHLSKQEFIDGDFSKLEDICLKRTIKEKKDIEVKEKLEYERLKKKFK